MSNFKTIPGYSNYEISEIGLIRNVKTKSVVKTENKGLSVRLFNDKKKRITCKVSEIKNSAWGKTEILQEITKEKNEQNVANSFVVSVKKSQKQEILKLSNEGRSRKEIREILGKKCIGYAFKDKKQNEQ